MRHLLLLPLVFALSGCAIGFNPDSFKGRDPALKPLNRADQEIVYSTCLRAKHISCSINPSLNTLLIHGKRDFLLAPDGRPSAFTEAQKIEAETIGNMWCALNRVQGSDATIIFRYPDKSMIGSSCQEVPT